MFTLLQVIHVLHNIIRIIVFDNECGLCFTDDDLAAVVAIDDDEYEEGDFREPVKNVLAEFVR